ncbi:MAG: undecaprenyl-diphosphate phosphatase [Clostridia bacterium]
MVLDLIEILKVVFLGVVEGITEWLPISSTGHMLLVDEFLNLSMSEEFKEMFFVVIQLGAIMAVVVIYWNKMFPFAIGKKQNEGSSKLITIKKDIFSLWFKVCFALIPSAVLGFLFDDWLEENFGSAFTIALMLIVYGVAFIVVEKWNKSRTAKVDSLADVTYTLAMLVGLFQVLSMIPGTSRSGATIVGALIIGLSRTVAAEFTFFLAVPTMLGASALKLVKFGFDFSSAELIALAIGMVVAFVTSIFAIKFLMNFIKKNDFTVFGWYRIVLGAIVLAYLAFAGF